MNRSSVYYSAKPASTKKIEREEYIKSRIDYWHTHQCYLGVRGLKNKLRKEDNVTIGRKLIRRYMEEIGIHAVYPKPNTSKRNRQHAIYPYLLRNKSIFMSNQVWAIDITYIKMGRTHMYLTAIIDWYSRFVVSWSLSDSLETAAVIEAVQEGIGKYGIPGIINSDQGSQFTSNEYSGLLRSYGIRQSMDGKARWVDNVIIERWFRSLKCENIYINDYTSPRELRHGIADYVSEYNMSRPHTEHDGDYPCEVYRKHFVA